MSLIAVSFASFAPLPLAFSAHRLPNPPTPTPGSETKLPDRCCFCLLCALFLPFLPPGYPILQRPPLALKTSSLRALLASYSGSSGSLEAISKSHSWLSAKVAALQTFMPLVSTAVVDCVLQERGKARQAAGQRATGDGPRRALGLWSGSGSGSGSGRDDSGNAGGASSGSGSSGAGGEGGGGDASGGGTGLEEGDAAGCSGNGHSSTGAGSSHSPPDLTVLHSEAGAWASQDVLPEEVTEMLRVVRTTANRAVKEACLLPGGKAWDATEMLPLVKGIKGLAKSTVLVASAGLLGHTEAPGVQVGAEQAGRSGAAGGAGAGAGTSRGDLAAQGASAWSHAPALHSAVAVELLPVVLHGGGLCVAYASELVATVQKQQNVMDELLRSGQAAGLKSQLVQHYPKALECIVDAAQAVRDAVAIMCWPALPGSAAVLRGRSAAARGSVPAAPRPQPVGQAAKVAQAAGAAGTGAAAGVAAAPGDRYVGKGGGWAGPAAQAMRCVMSSDSGAVLRGMGTLAHDHLLSEVQQLLRSVLEAGGAPKPSLSLSATAGRSGAAKREKEREAEAEAFRAKLQADVVTRRLLAASTCVRLTVILMEILELVCALASAAVQECVAAIQEAPEDESRWMLLACILG